jgi:hypothetical protein
VPAGTLAKQPVDPGVDRAILSIHEFQVEPIGQPEPMP